MNRKYLIAIIATIIIICAGAFALINSGTTINDTISIDANALEDKGNLVVDSESLDESNGKYHNKNKLNIRRIMHCKLFKKYYFFHSRFSFFFRNWT